MKFKRGSFVRFTQDTNINEALRGKVGKVLGRYKGPDVKEDDIAYKVLMLDPELTPANNGARDWDEDYWTPDESYLILVSKLEKSLL